MRAPQITYLYLKNRGKKKEKKVKAQLKGKSNEEDVVEIEGLRLETLTQSVSLRHFTSSMASPLHDFDIFVSTEREKRERENPCSWGLGFESIKTQG